MLRRLLHIVLSLLLVVSTTGLSLHKHFCGDSLQAISLQKLTGCCSADSTEAPADNDCCQNQTQQYQADTDFQAGHAPDFSALVAILPAPVWVAGEFLAQPSRQLSTYFTDSGPPPLPTSTYLSLLQQFRL
jgi:hypothetical protein